MRQQILHTPEGVRDIYGIECRRKLMLEEKLQEILHLYGYQDIQTPMFEFFDVFGKEIGTISSKELYKFFDRDGNTLVLRPDITPSIARVAATFLDSKGLPVRLCYNGNTFINHSSYRGKLKESTQMGAELLGIDSLEADAEMIALAADCLKAAGLNEFQIYIGNVDFFESLLEDAGLEEEKEARLRELIANRNYFGVEELLKGQSLDENLSKTFAELPQMFGSAEVLEKAKSLTTNTEALAAVSRLEEIYEILKVYGCEKYIAFDFGMLSKFRYYTGIIFQAYTYGTGEPLVKGGRYNELMKHFGKPASSIGFAIVVDNLMLALSRQKLDVPAGEETVVITYKQEELNEAIKEAMKLRKEGKNVALRPSKEEQD